MDETEPLYKLFNVHLYKSGSQIVAEGSGTGSSNSAVGSPSSFIDSDSYESGFVAGNLEYTGGYIQSANYVASTTGWKLDSTGIFYGTGVVISGAITATSGALGGFNIGSDYIRDSANSFGLASTVTGGDDIRFWAGATFANRATAPFRISEAGVVTMTQSQGTVRINTLGLTWLVGTEENANIRLFSGSDPVSSGVDLRFNVGGINGNSVDLDFIWTSNNTGKLTPGSSDTIDLGDSSNYFNEINYKTLTDRGCLGWFDLGVELQDGRTVSDIEAIRSVKKNTLRDTIYGVPMLDYSTMPKAVFKPAPIAKEDVYYEGKLRFKKGEKMGQDGAETTALISIMFGAIKELADKYDELAGRIDNNPKNK
jgi:hypothetical protein